MIMILWWFQVAAEVVSNFDMVLFVAGKSNRKCKNKVGPYVISCFGAGDCGDDDDTT